MLRTTPRPRVLDLPGELRRCFLEATDVMLAFTPEDFWWFCDHVWQVRFGCETGVACAPLAGDTIWLAEGFCDRDVFTRAAVLMHEATHLLGHDHACSDPLCLDPDERAADVLYQVQSAYREKIWRATLESL